MTLLNASHIAMRTDSTLSYLLSDHFGSTSLTTDASGALVSELRYNPWGETSYSSGATPTSYKYTGQREESSFGLYFYNARWYDPALGRFAQADSIVPPGPQGYDRYAYAFNNPVLYNDPDGHCGILCLVGGGLILWGSVALYVDIQVANAEPVGDTASNIWEIMKQGVNQADHVNITGEGLQSLQNDPSLISARDEIVADIRKKLGYGEQAFSIPDGNEKFTNKPFEANGPGGEWYTGLTEWNQAFLMVNSGTLSATNVKVSADGTISLTWNAKDQFDYLPDFRNDAGRTPISYVAYNLGAIGAYPAYHEKPFRTTATWNETIPPLSGSRQRYR